MLLPWAYTLLVGAIRHSVAPLFEVNPSSWSMTEGAYGIRADNSAGSGLIRVVAPSRHRRPDPVK